MNYKIEIAPEAQDEILKAKAWYEQQNPGFGESFSTVVKQHINNLRSDKVEHKPVLGPVRRVLVKRFPYVIYYTRHKEQRLVRILAVLHDRQNPIIT